MNEMKPNFLTEEMNDSYYRLPDPYENVPVCQVNLRQMSGYAKSVGKELKELSKEEVLKFSK